MKFVRMNILDYLDSQLMGKNYPEKFILPKEKIVEIETLLKEQGVDNCWVDFKTNGLLNNYRAIRLEIRR
jgi:hypothetical protein